jgi:hypothetical protein
MADKENYLIGTFANQSGAVWRLNALQRGLVVILARTGPGGDQEFENVKQFRVGPGETIHLLQPHSASKDAYLLQDPAGTKLHLAWDDRARLGIAQPGGSAASAAGVDTRDGRHRVQAEGGTVTVIRLDTADRKAQDPVAVPRPEAAAAGAAPKAEREPQPSKPAGPDQGKLVHCHPKPRSRGSRPAGSQ